jgi:hypothetical protein
MGNINVGGLVIKGASKKKGKKGRKIGRYAKHPSSMRYKAERRWEKNKVRRMRRHLKTYPSDLQAERLLRDIA